MESCGLHSPGLPDRTHRRDGPLPVGEAARIATEVAEALEEAARVRVVVEHHRRDGHHARPLGQREAERVAVALEPGDRGEARTSE